jgi:hypothetical protein
VKLSLDEQKHFIRRLTDKVVEGAEKTKQLFFACLCALVPLCGMRLFIFSQLQGSDVWPPARPKAVMPAM